MAFVQILPFLEDEEVLSHSTTTASTLIVWQALATINGQEIATAQ